MSAFTKNPHYFPADFLGNKDLPRQLVAQRDDVSVFAWMLKAGYLFEGVQVRIDKSLTVEFIHVDFPKNLTIEDVPYPARFMEVFFEDPNLPTLLLGRLDSNTPKGGLDLPSYGIVLPEVTLVAALEEEDTNGAPMLCVINLNVKDWEAVMSGEVLEDMDMGIPLEEGESKALLSLVSLAVQSFMYASIEGYGPVEVSRKQMRGGGKPGVKLRPARKSLRIARQHVLEGESIPTGRSVRPHIRKGHFRFFKSERYTEKVRGTFAYIAPVFVGVKKGARKP
jgi:hypothetical protein